MYCLERDELRWPCKLYTQLSVPNPITQLMAKYKHEFQCMSMSMANTTLQIRNTFGYPVLVSVRSKNSSILGTRSNLLARTRTGHGRSSAEQLPDGHHRYAKSVGSKLSRSDFHLDVLKQFSRSLRESRTIRPWSRKPENN